MFAVGTRVRVLDWNVNGFRTTNQPGLLDAMDWDIACLQEVTRESWPRFRNTADVGDVAFDHLPALSSGEPRYACAVLVRGLDLDGFELLPGMPSPERASVAVANVGGQQIQVGSWAAPPGVTWGDAGKGRQVDRFAAWLRDRATPVIVGIDRNAPKWERHDLASDEWWNRWEPLLYGPDRVHDLGDVYRTYLSTYPERAAQVRQERPYGPLAVTHRRRGVDCRYDAIYASPEFQVVTVGHHLDAALDAGSDHAIVTCDLVLGR
jgi:hypothetical protein